MASQSKTPPLVFASGTRGFASDNCSGAHAQVLEAIQNANVGHVRAYGNDPWTEAAVQKFQALFSAPVEVHFTFNGTGANILGLRSSTQPFQSILCAESAHIHVDECGAPEMFTGSKLIAITTTDGKLTPELVERYCTGFGDVHHSQPRVLSITQTTELGTLYQPDEIKKLADLCHQRNMILHMDGARIANAAAALAIPIQKFTQDVGVDVLSFGGTKNGMLYGEAVIFFNLELARNSGFLRKQSAQLASKMRFISAQFLALLTDDLWLKNATHANSMAKLLAKKIEGLSQFKLARPSEANAVFVRLSPNLIALGQQKSFFYVWNESLGEVRWMTSFDTTPEDIDQFLRYFM